MSAEREHVEALLRMFYELRDKYGLVWLIHAVLSSLTAMVILPIANSNADATAAADELKAVLDQRVGERMRARIRHLAQRN